MRTATGNQVLDALEENPRRRILESSKSLEIPAGTWLYRQGSSPAHLYFPISGVASIVSSTTAGQSGGLIIAGRMSMIGAEAMLNDAAMETSCYLHSRCEAIRVGVSDARSLLTLGHQGLKPILDSIRSALLMTQKTAVCNAIHSAQQRFAQWCLMFCDVSGGDEVLATQEKMAELLMVQRSTVSLVANEYQRSELIKIQRGSLLVRSRVGLEKRTCECYTTFQQLYPRLCSTSL